MTATAAGRYAAALFELAGEQNSIAGVEDDLGRFQAMIDDSEDLSRLVKSPLYSVDEQSRSVGAIAAKAELSPLVRNFLDVLIRNRRLFAVEDMIKVFRSLAAHRRGEVVAEVASATAISDAQMEELKATLKASVGNDVKLATRVDPSLLGGLIVKIGSRMIDSSLRTKLSNMRLALKGTG